MNKTKIEMADYSGGYRCECGRYVPPGDSGFCLVWELSDEGDFIGAFCSEKCAEAARDEYLIERAAA